MSAKRFLCVAVAMATVLSVGGCKPDLVVGGSEVTFCGPDPQTGQARITYTFRIENRDYGGSLFRRPGSVSRPISVQAWTSRDGVLGGDDTDLGATSFAVENFGPDGKLRPGESFDGEVSSLFTYESAKRNLVLVVDPPTSQQLAAQAGTDPVNLAQARGVIREYEETNNQNSTRIGRCADFDLTCTLTTGDNTLALPYRRQSGLNFAQDLMNDIGGSVVNVRRYRESGNTWETYSGGPGQGFPLAAGEGLMVEVSSDVDYRIRGSHDPTVTLQLDAPGPTSTVGKNFIALPYNTTAGDAQALMNDIGSGVLNVQDYVQATNSWTVYSGSKGQVFQIDPCKAYMVQMSSTVSYVPSHY